MILLNLASKLFLFFPFPPPLLNVILFFHLQGAFASAIHRAGYPASYRGVFPVKCNHDRDVVRAVVEFGLPYNFGLEVGSKAELVLAAATLAESGSSSAGTLIICNGYKDAEYMLCILGK